MGGLIATPSLQPNAACDSSPSFEVNAAPQIGALTLAPRRVDERSSWLALLSNIHLATHALEGFPAKMPQMIVYRSINAAKWMWHKRATRAAFCAAVNDQC